MTDRIELFVSSIPPKFMKTLLIVSLTGFTSLLFLCGAWGYTWAVDRTATEDALASELKTTREQIAGLSGQVTGLTTAVNQLAQLERERAEEQRDYRKEIRDFRQQMFGSRSKEVR